MGSCGTPASQLCTLLDFRALNRGFHYRKIRLSVVGMEEIASGPTNTDQTQRSSLVILVLYSVEVTDGDLLTWAHDVYIVRHPAFVL